MRKTRHRLFVLCMAAILMVLIVAACDTGTGASPSVPVSFLSAAQIGGSDGRAESTGITLAFDVDPVNLTAEDITVTGATIGELSGSGTTRTILISDITVENGKPVTISIADPEGYTMSGSTQSAVVYKAMEVGMEYQGGLIAYIFEPGDPVYVAGEFHGLIVSSTDLSLDQISTTNLTYWCIKDDWIEVGTTEDSIGAGMRNTEAIIAKQGDAGEGKYAAAYCHRYSVSSGSDEYSDWFLPSQNELIKIYENREVLGVFGDPDATYERPHFSSTEYSMLSYVLVVRFTDGYTGLFGKDNTLGNVRAARYF